MGNLVVQGKLEQGQVFQSIMFIRIGDGLLIQPSNRQVEIVSIESDSQKFESAEAGDKINVAIRGINNTIIKPGYCLCSRNKPIHTTDYFEAQFMIRECKNVNSAGFHCVVHVHAAQEEAIITKILSIVEKQKQRTLKSPLFVKVGQTVICRFRLANEICLEPYKTNQQFGRFIVRDENRTVGVGIVIAISTKNLSYQSQSQTHNNILPRNSVNKQQIHLNEINYKTPQYSISQLSQQQSQSNKNLISQQPSKQAPNQNKKIQKNHNSYLLNSVNNQPQISNQSAMFQEQPNINNQMSYIDSIQKRYGLLPELPNIIQPHIQEQIQYVHNPGQDFRQQIIQQQQQQQQVNNNFLNNEFQQIYPNQNSLQFQQQRFLNNPLPYVQQSIQIFPTHLIPPIQQQFNVQNLQFIPYNLHRQYIRIFLVEIIKKYDQIGAFKIADRILSQPQQNVQFFFDDEQRIIDFVIEYNQQQNNIQQQLIEKEKEQQKDNIKNNDIQNSYIQFTVEQLNNNCLLPLPNIQQQSSVLQQQKYQIKQQSQIEQQQQNSKALISSKPTTLSSSSSSSSILPIPIPQPIPEPIFTDHFSSLQPQISSLNSDSNQVEDYRDIQQQDKQRKEIQKEIQKNNQNIKQEQEEKEDQKKKQLENEKENKQKKNIEEKIKDNKEENKMEKFKDENKLKKNKQEKNEKDEIEEESSIDHEQTKIIVQQSSSKQPILKPSQLTYSSSSSSSSQSQQQSSSLSTYSPSNLYLKDQKLQKFSDPLILSQSQLSYSPAKVKTKQEQNSEKKKKVILQEKIKQKEQDVENVDMNQQTGNKVSIRENTFKQKGNISKTEFSYTPIRKSSSNQQKEIEEPIEKEKDDVKSEQYQNDDKTSFDMSLIKNKNDEDKQNIIGEYLYDYASKEYEEIAGKITGLILELDIVELEAIVQSKKLLNKQIGEAALILESEIFG